jgi:hypothetical protein
MLYIITLVIVVTGLVGFFKSLTKDERSLVTKGIINTASTGSVYAFKASKAGIKAAYDIGQISGMHMSLEGQETLTSIHTYNESITKEGGAAKVAVRIANDHSDAIGATDALKHLAEYKAKLKASLEAARAARK